MQRVAVMGLCAAVSLVGCGGGNADPKSQDVAVWVLEQGGEMSLVDKSLPVKQKSDLPGEPFGITRIDLKGKKVTDADLEKLSELTNLRELNLYNTRVGDAGLEHLKAIPTLEELELSNTQVTDQGLDTLAEFPSLKKVFLRNTVVTDSAVEELQNRRSDLTIYR